MPELNFTDEKSDLVQKYTLGDKTEAVPDNNEPRKLLLLRWLLVPEGVQMVRDLQKLQDDIEDKLHNSELSLFKNS